MRESFYLAYRYISYHRMRSLVLVFSIGLIIYLPNGLKKLINESEHQMISRAASTPLVVGAKGSSTDMVINALYFQQEKTKTISMSTLEKVNETGFGHAIPILNMFSARNVPIVGTDLDYFDFRALKIQSGNLMSFVGECVIGSEVAEQLDIGVGDSIISSPENFFDLAGIYPLKMSVVGVLEPSDSPDDHAIFVDVRTNWVIMGLGHGHEDLTLVSDPSVVLQRDSAEVKAGAKLFMYNTITGENIDSFHFHGDIGSYPLSSLIFVPKDHKSETLLRGRFESGAFEEQVIVPTHVVENLLQSIFRIKKVFDTVFVLVGIATAMILALIVILSVRLRKNEIYTMFTIGSSRGKVFEIITLELMILVAGSLVFVGGMYVLTGLFVDEFIYQFII